MKKITLLILVFLLGAISRLKAQIDPHFSQIYAYPLWLNPALTGVFDGDARFTANFRNQWTAIPNGYETGAVSGDYKVTDKMALGLNLINQTAGSSNFDYFAAYGTFGYAVPISSDGTKKLSFGLQVGFINRSFTPGDLQFDNQYNPIIGYDPNLSSGENFLTSNSFIFDSGAGIYYYDSGNDNMIKPFGGASIYHINGAADPFAAPGERTTLPIRFNIHGGAKIKASDDLDITPSLIYIRQQENQIRVLDVYAELKSKDGNGIIVGGMLRLDDAIVAEFGYHIGSTVLGFSYDINTSPLSTATSGHGGVELSLNYIFDSHSGNGSNSSSPRF